MNTPNKLTLLRIILIPILLVFVYKITPDNSMFSWISVILFALISITDTLDGYLARKNNQITDFGKFLDPLADKIFVLSTMIALVDIGLLSSVAVIIVIVREFLVTSLRLVASKDVVIAASIWGKMKTVIQMITLILVLLTHQIKAVIPFPIIEISVILMIIATIFSGLEYLVKNMKYIDYRK